MHQEYEELIVQSVFGELGREDEQHLKSHLALCPHCRKKKAEMESFALDRVEQVNLPDYFFKEARDELFTVLAQEKGTPDSTPAEVGFFVELKRFFAKPVFAYPLVFVSGFLIALMLFNSASQSSLQIISGIGNQEDNLELDSLMISNIKFVDNDASDGEITFSFDASRKFVVSGSINEAKIRKLLMNAMLNEVNPATRLNSFHAFKTSQVPLRDEQMKQALITLLLQDENAGVRIAAVKQLKEFEYDLRIKEALLKALSSDGNSAVRIEAINALGEALSKTPVITQEGERILRERAETDDNEYVKFKAKTIIEAI